MNEKRKGIWKAVVLMVLFMSAQFLLKEDGKVFAVWWLTILVLGWCSFPLCQYLFSGFRDRGYLVAKIFGIAGAGFLMWLGASTGIVPFTHVGCLVSTGVLAAVCWGVWIALKKQKIKDKTSWKFTTEWYYCSARLLSDLSGGRLEDFFLGLQQNNPNYRSVWDTYLKHLAVVINNLHMILDYDIVLGGYVGSFLTPWLDTIRHLVAERNTFEDDGSFVKLCTYQTGAAAYGAAMDVMEEFLRTV